MSDSEFEPTQSSGSDDDGGSDYVVSEEEEEPQQRTAVARAPPRRGAGSGGATGVRRPAPAAAPKAKRARQAAQPKLTDLLHSASKEQLVNLVLELNGEVAGGLEGRIAALLPPPDLTGIKASIETLARKMWKAFPHAKWGTNRDAYAYKRVGPAVRDLKAALLEHGRTFADCKRHDTLLDYALFALEVADGMPQWDADKHNKPRQQAAKALEGLLIKAIKAGAVQSEGQRQGVLRQLEGMELPLEAARAALGAAA